MRNRTLNGRMACLCVASLIMATGLVGCGGGNGTYNPTLTGGGTPAPVASFTLIVTPTIQSLLPGGATAYTATVTSVNSFASPVTLNVTGLPEGATATFGPTSVTPTADGTISTLTVNTTGASGPGNLTGTIESVGKTSRDVTVTPPGAYTLTVTASGSGLTQRSTVTLNVLSSAVPPFTPEPGPLAFLVATGLSTAGVLIRRRGRKQA